MTVEFESEVQEMCNLSEALVELGAEREKLSLAQLMIKENEPVEKIERYTGYALEKLKEISNGMGIPLMKYQMYEEIRQELSAAAKRVK